MIDDYTPTVDDVAQLVPARAAGRFTGGASVPEFPDTTRVRSIIEDAVGLIAPALGGDDLNERFYDGARALIKLQAAILLEPSAWPEQARPDKSAFDQWNVILEGSRKALTAAVVRFRDTGGDDPGTSQGVIAAFPPPGILRPCPEEW